MRVSSRNWIVMAGAIESVEVQAREEANVLMIGTAGGWLEYELNTAEVGRPMIRALASWLDGEAGVRDQMAGHEFSLEMYEAKWEAEQREANREGDGGADVMRLDFGGGI